MRLRSMLMVTWLVFAALATAAGFAAVGLVGQGLDVNAAQVIPPGGAQGATGTLGATTGTPKATAKKAATRKPSAKHKPSASRTAGAATNRPRTTSPAQTSPRRPAATSGAQAPASRTESRSKHGNFVSATCRGASVTLSASPAPGWRLDDYRPGPAQEARAKFRSDSGEVEFRVVCSGGRPVFDIKDSPDGGGG